MWAVITMNADEPQLPRDDDISVAGLLYWGEFCCWTTVALWPFLRWANGEAVSRDQALIRGALGVVAILSAVGIRGYKIISAGRGRQNDGLDSAKS